MPNRNRGKHHVLTNRTRARPLHSRSTIRRQWGLHTQVGAMVACSIGAGCTTRRIRAWKFRNEPPIEPYGRGVGEHTVVEGVGTGMRVGLGGLGGLGIACVLGCLGRRGHHSDVIMGLAVGER